MKKLMLLTAAVLSAAPAAAQQKPVETYTLTLTPLEVNSVGVALAQRPYGEVSDLLAKLKDQVNKQNEAANPATTVQNAPAK